ncbi:MAG: hypothetical protein JJT96_03495 [Opitutales bacterium]|nr:hypothetical protein [Opitutales bacterium]
MLFINSFFQYIRPSVSSKLLLSLLFFGISVSTFASNFVREKASFPVVSDFAPDLPVSNFATGENAPLEAAPPHVVHFAEFVALLQDAVERGDGGVVNFDNPFFGGRLLMEDRTWVRAFIEEGLDQWQLNLGPGELPTESARQSEILRLRREAEDRISRSLLPVEARNDPSREQVAGGSVNPLGNETFFDRMEIVFGTGLDRSLTIRRGEFHYIEGGLASAAHPGAEALGSRINDNNFFTVGRSTYSGGELTAASSPFSLASGIAHLEFDAADNIQAIGFVLLSVNNFQYWQGLGAIPDNPGNIIVRTFFSDGSDVVTTSNTRQSNGGWNTFFGIRSPRPDVSITGVKVRIVGRNFRTFVFMDDFAFITAPAAPFLASEDTLTASAGRRVFYGAVFGQRPSEVEVFNLPSWLSFDPETNFLHGRVPDSSELVSDSYDVVFRLRNSFTQTDPTFLAENDGLDYVDYTLNMIVLPEISDDRLPALQFLAFERDPSSLLPEVFSSSNRREVDRPQSQRPDVFFDFRFDVARFLDEIFNPWMIEGSGVEVPEGVLVGERIFNLDDVDAFIALPDRPANAPADYTVLELARENRDTLFLAGSVFSRGEGSFSITVPLRMGPERNNSMIYEEFLNPVPVTFSFRVPDVRDVENLALAISWDPFSFISEGEEVIALLRRNLIPRLAPTRADLVDPENLNRFSSRVFRIESDGRRVGTTLATAGLAVSDGFLMGVPSSGSSIGFYEIEFIVFNRFGADSFSLFLRVVPPVPLPNFDGNGNTDLAWLNQQTGTVHLLRTVSSLRAENMVDFRVSPNWRAEAFALAGEFSVTSQDRIAFGDFNASTSTDLMISQLDTVGSVALLNFSLDQDVGGFRIDHLAYRDLAPDWDLLVSGDMQGQFASSFLWQQRGSGNTALWQTGEGELLWSGFLFNDNVVRDFVLGADFKGDGTTQLLFRRGEGHFEFVDARIQTSGVLITSEEFAMSPEWRPHLAGDLTGNGRADLLWKSSQTGEVTLWRMNGASVPSDFRVSEEVSGSLVKAVPGEVVLNFALNKEVVALADVDENGVDDMILQHRLTGDLFVLPFSQEGPLASPFHLRLPAGLLYPEILSVGWYDGGRSSDLLVRDIYSGRTYFLLFSVKTDLDTSVPLETSGGNFREILTVVDGEAWVYEVHFFDVFDDDIEFLSGITISRDSSIPAGVDDPLPPWEDAEPLGDRWFVSPWYGTLWDPAEGFIYHAEHGFQFVFGESAEEGLWFFDSNLDWLWTNTTAYPWFFFPRFGSWILFEQGTVIPNRRFFEISNFVDWVQESEL